MANAKVIDKDFGYAKWLQQMKEVANKPFTKIGVLGTSENTSTGEGGTTVLQYASANEFGASGAGRNGSVTIPERSYIRSTIDERKRRIFGKAFNLQKDIFLGKISMKKALSIMGLLIKGNIVQKIVSLRSPANAASTIRKKGSSNPLIDEGRLRQSIDFEVEAK